MKQLLLPNFVLILLFVENVFALMFYFTLLENVCHFHTVKLNFLLLKAETKAWGGTFHCSMSAITHFKSDGLSKMRHWAVETGEKRIGLKKKRIVT